MDEVEGIAPTDPEDARQFSQVISGLQKSYPRDKICLLHLANEQGLKLESAAESNAFVEKGLVENVDEKNYIYRKEDWKYLGYHQGSFLVS